MASFNAGSCWNRLPPMDSRTARFRRLVKKEYFPNQFTVMPRDGDKVNVGGAELTWHAVDTTEL